jgi:hypothetical protein
MSTREQEFAHTAGLLHDIGKFVLSDRVMERGGELRDPDWQGIRRHPTSAPSCCATSASMARSPTSSARTTSASTGAATRAGCGGEIPPIARIVAVAEVYDTLTAPDTYRTPMTSFEALNELRRVAGAPARRDLRRGARRAAGGPRHGVPPRRRGGLRPRARHRAADERGRGSVTATTAWERRRGRGIVTSEHDTFGDALLDALAGREARVSVERDDGWRDEYDVGLYLNGAGAWAPAARRALQGLTGRVLDVGAGAGRHARFLAGRGCDVTALDSSPVRSRRVAGGA